MADAPFDDEIIINDLIGFAVRGGDDGGIRFETRVTILPGNEKRTRLRTEVTGRWTVEPVAKSDAEFDAFYIFWMAREGMHRGFRFLDPRDNSVTGQVLISEVQGGETSVQLVKTYADAGNTHTRKITRPFGTVQVYLGGVPIEFSLDRTTGIVTFEEGGSPEGLPGPESPNLSLTADFSFHVPVRLDQDNPPIIEPTFNFPTFDAFDIVVVPE